MRHDGSGKRHSRRPSADSVESVSDSGDGGSGRGTRRHSRQPSAASADGSAAGHSNASSSSVAPLAATRPVAASSIPATAPPAPAAPSTAPMPMSAPAAALCAAAPGTLGAAQPPPAAAGASPVVVLHLRPSLAAPPAAPSALSADGPPAPFSAVAAALWPLLAAAFVATALLELLFPFFTYVPEQANSVLTGNLAYLMFYVRIFSEMAGRALPRWQAFKTESYKVLLAAAGAEVGLAACFMAYLKAPWRLDAVPLALVAAIWLTGAQRAVYYVLCCLPSIVTRIQLHCLPRGVVAMACVAAGACGWYLADGCAQTLFGVFFVACYGMLRGMP